MSVCILSFPLLLTLISISQPLSRRIHCGKSLVSCRVATAASRLLLSQFSPSVPFSESGFLPGDVCVYQEERSSKFAAAFKSKRRTDTSESLLADLNDKSPGKQCMCKCVSM